MFFRQKYTIVEKNMLKDICFAYFFVLAMINEFKIIITRTDFDLLNFQ